VAEAAPETSAMRQIWITRAGPPEVLEVREAADPEPKAGEVRIRVAASGVNFADILGRMGLYPDLPSIPVVPGYEVSGRVDAAGADVDGNWAGREVLALTRFGGYERSASLQIRSSCARRACPQWKPRLFRSTISPLGNWSSSWAA
jgi:NADPH:quinone reductase-like Zn-dependent oxidoreductase